MNISKRSQQKFSDLCSTWGTVRKIWEVFDAEDFVEAEGYVVEQSGVRRSQADAFHSAIDLNDPDQQGRLLRVYLSAIDDWGYEQGELVQDAVALIKSLQRDGAPIDEHANLIGATPKSIYMSLDQFDRLSQPGVLIKHLERIDQNLASDPAAAIASSKELVESTCKFVLDDYGVSYDKNDSLTDLYKKTAATLKINRNSVPESRKGSESANKILQNLATTVQSMAELRNELGLGHGKTRNSPALERHARLAFNAARTTIEFILQTWHARKAEDRPSLDQPTS